VADLVVVGSYNASMTVYSARLPTPGETVVGSHFDRGPGGKGANQAIGARRLGTDVLFITRLGADAFGDKARSILLAEGLPEHGITTDAQSPTGIALVLVDDSGQNAIAVAPGANLELSAPDVLESFGEDLRSCQCVTCWPASCWSTESATSWSRSGNAAPCGHRRRGCSISMPIRSGPSTPREQETHSTLAWPRLWSVVSRWSRRSFKAAAPEHSA